MTESNPASSPYSQNMAEGNSGITDAHFVVCDACGYLWDIEPQWPDPILCPHCKHTALWRFPALEQARFHSYHVIEGRGQ